MNVSLQFYNLFYQLEDSGCLNVDNEVHVGVLRFCFLQLYNIRLCDWRKSWNCHKIKSAGHRTPVQLWLNNNDVKGNEVKLCVEISQFRLVFPFPKMVCNLFVVICFLLQDTLRLSSALTCITMFYSIINVFVQAFLLMFNVKSRLCCCSPYIHWTALKQCPIWKTCVKECLVKQQKGWLLFIL